MNLASGAESEVIKMRELTFKNEFRGSNNYLIKEGDYVLYKNRQYRVLKIGNDEIMTIFTLEDFELIDSNLEIVEADIVLLFLNEEVEEKIKILKTCGEDHE